jgi:LCP family protein required for cell wall assembly
MRLFNRDPDPFAASRYSGIVKGFKRRERAHMRHWWQWGLLGFFVLVILLAGFGIWRYFHYKCKITCGQPKAIQAGEGKPFNVLLIGSDSRTGLTAEQQFELGAAAVGGERADTLILAHIDPAEDHVTMVQFPRDLYVPLAGGASNRVNAALVEGIRPMLATMRQLTGLTINYFAKINIAGFRDLVDAIGGVEICLTEPIAFDPQTGLEVTEDEVPGLVKFDGDRALRFVRSRRFPTGDFERIQNQQRFIAAAIDKILSAETLLHPSRIIKLADAAGKHLRANLDPFEMRDLADRLQPFDPRRYEAYTVPNLGTSTNEVGSVVLPDMPAMRLMFRAIDKNESPAEADGVANIEPSTIRVGVYNGTFEVGAADAARAQLEEATDIGAGPVRVVEIGNADRFRYRRTVIRYGRTSKKMAELVAAAIPRAKLEETRTKQGVDVEVIVGRKFSTRQIVQINPIPIPKPGDTPPECRR